MKIYCWDVQSTLSLASMMVYKQRLTKSNERSLDEPPQLFCRPCLHLPHRPSESLNSFFLSLCAHLFTQNLRLMRARSRGDMCVVVQDNRSKAVASEGTMMSLGDVKNVEWRGAVVASTGKVTEKRERTKHVLRAAANLRCFIMNSDAILSGGGYRM